MCGALLKRPDYPCIGGRCPNCGHVQNYAEEDYKRVKTYKVRSKYKKELEKVRETFKDVMECYFDMPEIKKVGTHQFEHYYLWCVVYIRPFSLRVLKNG